jgi:DNA-binding PadR family transcriptional regulator
VSDDYSLGTREERILRAVNEFYTLTTTQVTRLFFAEASIAHVRKILAALKEHGYLTSHKMPKEPGKGGGNTQHVFSLTGKGATVLDELGYSPRPHLVPSKEADHRWLFAFHEARVNDALIAATLLGQRHPGVTLVERHHERDLKRDPVLLPRGKVVLDGWVQWHVVGQAGKVEYSLGFEVDRGTEDQGKFRQKVAQLVAMLIGSPSPYQRHFGTDVLTIAVVAPTAHRRDLLRQWIEVELGTAGRRAYAALFLVTSADPTLDPADFFTLPHWHHPFGGTAPILELEASTGCAR